MKSKFIEPLTKQTKICFLSLFEGAQFHQSSKCIKYITIIFKFTYISKDFPTKRHMNHILKEEALMACFCFSILTQIVIQHLCDRHEGHHISCRSVVLLFKRLDFLLVLAKNNTMIIVYMCGM